MEKVVNAMSSLVEKLSRTKLPLKVYGAKKWRRKKEDFGARMHTSLQINILTFYGQNLACVFIMETKTFCFLGL